MKPERRKTLKRCQNKKRFAKFDSRIRFSFFFFEKLVSQLQICHKASLFKLRNQQLLPSKSIPQDPILFFFQSCQCQNLFWKESLAVRSLDQNSITQRAFISKAYNVTVLYVFLWKLQLFFKTYLIRWAYFAISAVCKVVARRNLSNCLFKELIVTISITLD